ncbi:TonB-dependent receptor [Riemerella anatipestifer]|uniref:TonB-dependent receptor n=1 Tax=Riemerella anatipestifer TaxID=34085 RepID=UPI001AD6F8C7|nr:TonB-dependent receptor [Riemerella anatipestifer]MBO4233043.1 TonB-dependent receptor [Riemerella anatipestifer]
MNKHKIIALILLGWGSISLAQIKEEKLILDRKREPEVKRIEKKKTSVAIEKNYPPEEKQQEPINYEVVNVPVLSDFKTSAIQGEDISPEFNRNYLRNYFRIGYGNYNQFLADANVSGKMQDNLEVGANVHYLSNEGLKKQYTWNSSQKQAEISGFLNHFGEKGKANLTTSVGLNDYNYYGIYALVPNSDADLGQKYSRFQISGNYDFYSNEIFNDITVKTSAIRDRFKANESQIEALVNLSKHHLKLGQDLDINLDLGVKMDMVNTQFNILNQHNSRYFGGGLSPKITFKKGQSYLKIGSGFNLLSSSLTKLNETQQKSNRFYWFPQAELFVAATPEANLYGGVESGLQFNTYSRLLEQNPFLVSDLELKPTHTKYQFYFGVKGVVSEQIKYDVKASYGKLDNMMFFGGNSLFSNLIDDNSRLGYDYANTFSTTYHNGTLSQIKGEIEYKPLASLVLDGNIQFQKYNLENNVNVYYRPLLQASIGAKYQTFKDKLLLGFRGFFVSDRMANRFSINPSGILISTPIYAEEEIDNQKVGGYADLNISAEYQINKNFSIFALGNNLLGANYQNCYGYKVLGTQIMGGLKIKF